MPRLASAVLAIAGAVALAVPLAPATARADGPEAQAGALGEEPLAEGERRPVPDYDGRPARGTDAEDVALWIPRVIFSPLYLVTEYVLRRPIGFVMTELERVEAFDWIYDLFTFGPDRQAGVFPTLFWELGFNPSVGFYAYWDRFLVDENRIAMSGGTWGPDWLSFSVIDRIRPIPLLDVLLRFNALRRPDQLFGGIGWNATRTERSRYAIDLIDASGRVEHRPWRQSEVRYELGYRSASFESNRFDGDPGVLEVGQIPPAFDTGYSAVRAGIELILDTRELAELSTGGVRAVAFAQQNAAFGGIPLTRWVRWGGSLLFAIDALGNGRVLGIRGDAGLISQLDGDPGGVVPFTELFDLGGETQTMVRGLLGPLPGFRPGLVRGSSVVAVSVSYVWPVWVWADAHLRLGVGNVFGEHFEDFDLERLRLSFDAGLLPRIAGEHPFEVLFGIGTHTFEAGAGITSVRFAVGTRSGI